MTDHYQPKYSIIVQHLNFIPTLVRKISCNIYCRVDATSELWVWWISETDAEGLCVISDPGSSTVCWQSMNWLTNWHLSWHSLYKLLTSSTPMISKLHLKVSYETDNDFRYTPQAWNQSSCFVWCHLQELQKRVTWQKCFAVHQLGLKFWETSSSYSR